MRTSVRNKNFKRLQKYLNKKQRYGRRKQRVGFLNRYDFAYAGRETSSARNQENKCKKTRNQAVERSR